MKIAWIEHHYRFNDLSRNNLINYLKNNGLESKIDIEESLTKFNEKFGSLSNYDALLLHPGIANQEKYLRKIPTQNKNIKIYFLSYDPSDYNEFLLGGLKVIEVSYALPEIIKESELGELIEKLTRE